MFSDGNSKDFEKVKLALSPVKTGGRYLLELWLQLAIRLHAHQLRR